MQLEVITEVFWHPVPPIPLDLGLYRTPYPTYMVGVKSQFSILSWATHNNQWLAFWYSLQLDGPRGRNPFTDCVWKGEAFGSRCNLDQLSSPLKKSGFILRTILSSLLQIGQRNEPFMKTTKDETKKFLVSTKSRRSVGNSLILNKYLLHTSRLFLEPILVDSMLQKRGIRGRTNTSWR